MKIKYQFILKKFIPYKYLPVLLLFWIFVMALCIVALNRTESLATIWMIRIVLLLFTIYAAAALIHYRKLWAGSKGSNQNFIESLLSYNFEDPCETIVQLNGKNYTVVNGKIQISKEEEEHVRMLFGKLYTSKCDTKAPALDFFKIVIKELGFYEYHYINNYEMYHYFNRIFLDEMGNQYKKNRNKDFIPESTVELYRPAPFITSDQIQKKDAIRELINKAISAGNTSSIKKELPGSAESAHANEPIIIKQNRQSLALLFEDMDRTMFINMHNLRLNTSPEWNAKERFWYEYYDKFINNTLKRLFLDDDLHKMSREVLRKNLKREARSVYDLNNFLLAEKAGLEKLKAEGKENDPVAYVQVMMSVYGSEERREAWRDLIDLDFKDSLRERVEELIDEVFDNPDEVRKGVDEHWSDLSLCAFQRQLGAWIRYSKESWRRSNPAEWVEEYLK